MGYANHIGRVGALAVPLGVGLMVASPPSFVSAQPDSGAADSSPATAGAADTAADPASSGGEASAGPPPSSTEPAASDVAEVRLVPGRVRLPRTPTSAAVDSADTSPAEAEGDPEPDTEESDGAAAVEAADDIAEEIAVTGIDTAPAEISTPPAESSTVVEAASARPRDAAERGGAGPDEVSASVPSPQLPVAVQSLDDVRIRVHAGPAAASPVTAAPAAAVADDEAGASNTATPSAQIEVAEASAHAVPMVQGVLLQVLGLLGFNPSAPGFNPVLEFMWGLYRRVESLFYNEAPTVGVPTVTSTEQLATGAAVVTGNLGVTDFNQDALTYAVTDGQFGTVQVDSTGAFTYTLSNPNQAALTEGDTFTVRVSDGAGNTTVATYRIAIGGLNNAPVAVADSAVTNEDTSVAIDTASLLANDSDVDGDVLSVTAVSGAVGGSAVLSGGVITFAPDENFHGTGSFTYTVSDGAGGTATAPVTVAVAAVNDEPVARADTAFTVEDSALLIGASALANDTDGDHDELSVTAVLGAVGGTAMLTLVG